MSTYFVKVRLERERIVKVEADSEKVALDAAGAVMQDYDEADPPTDWDDAYSKTVLPLTYTFDDSIVAVTGDDGDYKFYEHAADDPAGRGEAVLR